MNKLRTAKPQDLIDDPEVHDATQDSIKTAEQIKGESLRDPNLHKESWWYFDLDDKRNAGLKAGEKVDRGPRYYDGDDHDPDVEGTLRSARLAEDFYGVRHPNRFTGEFDENGKHVISGDSSGKGNFANMGNDGKGPGPGSPPKNEAEKYDEDGHPIDPHKSKFDKKKSLSGGKGYKCPDDPTGLHGYCGAPLDPNDPDYQDDYSKSPHTTYFDQKRLGGEPHPKDWWNNLIKDRLADAGYPGDGMMSSKILNAGGKHKMKMKYGEDWDYMSEKEKDKLEKEEMDKDAVD